MTVAKSAVAGIGLCLLFHAGYVIMQQRKQLMSMGIFDQEVISLELGVQILLGTLISLWGGAMIIVQFKPIQSADVAKPSVCSEYRLALSACLSVC
eukprot:Cvel_28131.t1-p1 / transcript=Cvel_28131.t1 / gene=Cvel_28131 / organism=Chromera_velia_CCMP2878 / gene_product=hypothetical protein / transcript_product=hypothetical protein / location=Cvel_scaffold3629:14047-15063(+) / protein_length=95 / sequence_SO=supercontig / SO=protein_coding / is_pseudo=false